MKLTLIRHGMSEWNKKNLFTGWVDVNLAPEGIEEAKNAGKKLSQENIEFDIVYTSVLKRAIKTSNLVLEEIDQLFLPVSRSWRLNERHYGALQGLNKEETAVKYGAEKVKIWRRSYDTLPPLLDKNDPLSAHQDRRYSNIPSDSIPDGENLKVTLERVIPYWQDSIAPQLLNGKNVLIVAHGNSLRALIKHLEQISDDDIMAVELATGQPIIYDIDENLNIVDKKILI
ncbi:MAG: 2,3-diphosphoglycerate-dependent phosphoglycerate mutase [Psittacicella sp.]